MISEKHHAFLSCAFYSVLCEELGQERGEVVFRFSVRQYAQECGARMAQRAMRDDCPTDGAAFLHYREWEPSAPGVFEGETLSLSPDYGYAATRCPWREQFRTVPRCGEIYCRELNAAMVSGFHFGLEANAACSLSEGDRCVFVLSGAKMSREEPPDPADLRDWNYHCGNLLAVYRRVAYNILGNEQILTHRLGQKFSRAFGPRALHELEQAARLDFAQI